MRRNDTHSGTDFIGPECNKILDSVDKLAEKTSDEVRAKFKRSSEEYTPDERRDRAVAPQDPHKPKQCVPRDVLDVHVRVLQYCSAMSNFNNIMLMTKPGANPDAFEESHHRLWRRHR